VAVEYSWRFGRMAQSCSQIAFGWQYAEKNVSTRQKIVSARQSGVHASQPGVIGVLPESLAH
jgi:hypothetical protein